MINKKKNLKLNFSFTRLFNADINFKDINNENNNNYSLSNVSNKVKRKAIIKNQQFTDN